MSDAPDIVGTAEAGKILGTSPPNITRNRKAGKMPKPAAELAATVVWHRADVEAINVGNPTYGGKLSLVGTSEVAEILEVNKSQIGRWRRAGTFPEPCAQLTAGPVWWRKDIMAFKRKRS